MSKPGRTNFGFASFPRTLAAWFALLALAWSGQAAATIGCEIQYNSSSFQQGDAGTTVNFSFDIVDTAGGTACPPTVVGTITEGPDSTGGASAPPNWSGPPGSTVNISVTLGPTSGGTVTYTVDCPGCVAGANQLTWTAATNSTWDLVPTTATSFLVSTGESVPLGVKYYIDTGPSGLDTDWSVDNPSGNLSFTTVSADGADVHNNFFYSSVPGTYTVTVNGYCPVILVDALAAPTTSCPPNPETFTIVVEDPVLTPVQPPGGTATITQDSSILLKVKYASASIVVDNEFITWEVTSEPSAGASSFTGGAGTPAQIGTVTDANGETQVTFNVTTAGTYTVLACHQSDGCLTGDDQTTFTITVLATNADLAISKNASPSPVFPGGELTYNILVDNLGPDASPNVVVTDTLPAQLSFVSIRTTPGWNCTTPPAGSGGTITCDIASIALNDQAGIQVVTTVAPATPIGSTITNSASVDSPADSNSANDTDSVTTPVAAPPAAAMTVTKVLTGTVDNDGSGSVSIGDRLDYEVTAKNTGGAPLTDVLVSDDHFAATQACATLAPNATCVLTGSYVVTGADLTAGSVTNIGSATSNEVAGPISSSVITPIVAVEPVTLGVGSGDGQSTEVNTPFPQPLTVVAGGVPPSPPAAAGARASNLAALAAPNITINWQVMSGSAELAADTSVTNASGVASNNVDAGPDPGPVVIRAARDDDPSVFVEFNLTVTAAEVPKLGELPGLDENQKALADALDEICSSIPGGGSSPGDRTAASSSDLLERCEDLLAAIATDPSGVIDALDQLFADIALVQSESSLLAAQSQFDNIKARIAALRSGTNRTSFGGLAFRNASGRMPIGTMFQSLFAQDPGTEGGGAPKEVGTDFSRWGFFASGTIGRGDAEAGSLSPEYDFDIDGLTFGADYRHSDKLIFGGTLGYTRQTNDLANDRGDLETKGWSISAYGTWYQQSSWYVDGVLSWGQNSYEIERHVRYVITTPSGTTTIDNSGHGEGDGDSLTAALSVGRDFNKGGWGFGPYLRAMYTRMNFDTVEERFDETLPGNGLALELDTRSVTSLTSTLGGKLTYAHSTSWGVLIPHLQFEWQHEFEDDPALVEMRFLADPTQTPFTIHGDAVDTDFFRFGVGMSFVMTKGRSGFFYYERLISRERFSQNSLALGIRLEF